MWCCWVDGFLDVCGMYCGISVPMGCASECRLVLVYCLGIRS